VDTESPAISVTTSIDTVWPVTIAPTVPIDQALDVMKGAGVRLLLVIDPEQGIVGLISAEDIMGEEPIRIAEEQRVPRTAILVHQVMTTQEEVRVLDLRSVRDAQVGHILATLDRLQRQHVLVVEQDEAAGEQTVVGLFSRTYIAKRMLRQKWQYKELAGCLRQTYSLWGNFSALRFLHLELFLG
jgi:CBS domain-containing protein